VDRGTRPATGILYVFAIPRKKEQILYFFRLQKTVRKRSRGVTECDKKKGYIEIEFEAYKRDRGISYKGP
jgi:hypothetical protein